MREHTVLRVVAKLLAPLIMLFALYVQFHGEYSPGGGFQAGVIFAAGIVLFTLVFGLEAARTVMSPTVIRLCAAGGVLLYAGTGVAAMLMGGNFLEYGVLMHDPVHGQHLGIILVEFGVGLTVAGTLTGVFFVVAGRGRRRPGDT